MVLSSIVALSFDKGVHLTYIVKPVGAKPRPRRFPAAVAAADATLDNAHVVEDYLARTPPCTGSSQLVGLVLYPEPRHVWPGSNDFMVHHPMPSSGASGGTGGSQYSFYIVCQKDNEIRQLQKLPFGTATNLSRDSCPTLTVSA